MEYLNGLNSPVSEADIKRPPHIGEDIEIRENWHRQVERELSPCTG